MKRAVVCVLVVVLAGCAAPFASSDRSSPSTDRLGWEAGYWAEDDIAVDATDGLNESEQEAMVSRAMARIETLRSLEFDRPVEVSVINRTEYRRNQPFVRGSQARSAWNNQVWEGLFIVGEDSSITDEFNATFGSAVLGYYSPRTGEIVIVSNDDEPVLSRSTLVHELVHALQDQQFGLAATARTQDAQLARNGVVEGEATLIERRYESRCGIAWDCVETPTTDGGAGSGVNRGVLLVTLTPYVVGPGFVADIEGEGGWTAVNDLHEDFPTTTEQILSPEKYPDEKAQDVTVPDRSGEEWSRFDHTPVADSVGQASIHAMFVHNNVRSADVRRFRYDHPASVGWDGDTLVPYRNGSQYGYVWETAWETESEAREFERAYRELIKSKGGRFRGNVAVIPEVSPFGDAFRVTRDGTRVRVVNGPTEDSLTEIHGR